MSAIEHINFTHYYLGLLYGTLPCTEPPSVEKHKGLTASHINIQLDPFASKLTTYFWENAHESIRSLQMDKYFFLFCSNHLCHLEKRNETYINSSQRSMPVWFEFWENAHECSIDRREWTSVFCECSCMLT